MKLSKTRWRWLIPLSALVHFLVFTMEGEGGIAATPQSNAPPATVERSPASLDAADVQSGLRITKALTEIDALSRIQELLESPPVKPDIAPELFKDFWLKWEMVTARYKVDGQELRYIYANKIGSEALAKGTYPFPEGTVFAKIGAKAVHDPIFDTSLIPGPIARVQIMLKSKNDPNARNGWVYSLYIPPLYVGHLTNSEIDACDACHIAATRQDKIFSRPFPGKFGASQASAGGPIPFEDRYKSTKVKSLDAGARKFIELSGARVGENVMLLTMSAFDGTLFESRELLAKLARKYRRPYLLRSRDGNNLMLAIPSNGPCIQMASITPRQIGSVPPSDNSASAWNPGSGLLSPLPQSQQTAASPKISDGQTLQDRKESAADHIRRWDTCY